MPTKEELLEYFKYFNGKLIRKKKTGRKGLIGCEVGSYADPTRVLVRFKGKSYPAHRLIWVMHYGSIDEKLVIDHIDHNPHNNKIENLRLVTQLENIRNQSRSKRNTTGVPNVFFHRNRYIVSFKEKRRNRQYGTFRTLEDAKRRREEVRALLGFHPNHGQVLE